MIDTPEQLLAALMADAELPAFIGTYTFDDGLTADSIAILSPGEFIEGLSKVAGVEVIVNRAPTTTSRPLYDDCGVPEKSWKIHIIGYDPGNGAMNAADRIVQLFPGTTYADLGAGSLQDIAGLIQLGVNIPANVAL